LEQQHAIYKLAQDDISQFERMSYEQYTFIEQSSENLAFQVDGALIAIQQESQESSTKMQNVLNTSIANIAVMPPQTEIFGSRSDQEMEMLHKEVLQFYASVLKLRRQLRVFPKCRATMSRELFWPMILSGRCSLKSWQRK
jgi:hypothetical protein